MKRRVRRSGRCPRRTSRRGSTPGDVDTGSGKLAKKPEIYFELPADRDQFWQLFVGFEKDRLANPAAAVKAAAEAPGKGKCVRQRVAHAN